MSSIAGALADFSTWLASLVPDSGDTPQQARVRALGVNPATGQVVAPQMLETLGVDPSDPVAVKKFIDSTEAQVTTELETGKAAAFNQLGGVSLIPFAPVVGGDGAAIQNATSAVTQAFTSSTGSTIFVVIIAVVFIFILFKVVD